MSAAVLTTDAASEGTLQIAFAGDWMLAHGLPGPDPVLDELRKTPKPAGIVFETSGLGSWDTGLVKTLMLIHKSANANGVQIDDSGLPEGATKLIALALAVKERDGARRSEECKPLLQQVGDGAIEVWEGGRDLLTFVGETILSTRRYISGKATYLKSDVALHIQEAGADAFPIVSLISFLIGMIFAFVGVMQLQMFGAGIFTANLVALAMVREMAAIMTAIIMAGRTGAAYAAQIGTMKVNEEVDALTTMGINPIDFLVTPRVLALILMMPLLTLYSSLMGILGGTVVGVLMLDVSLVQYVEQTLGAVQLNSLFGGLFKSLVYGILVALAGCQQGMACGNSAMAVGQCTTKAVVMGIVLIVISASILTIIYINLGI
ncbi:MAG: MlaE family ABC transporter permease [Gammaproteobacteria bacterium]